MHIHVHVNTQKLLSPACVSFLPFLFFPFFLLYKKKMMALSVFGIITLCLPCQPVSQQSASSHWLFFNKSNENHKGRNKFKKISFTSTIKPMLPVCSHNGPLLMKNLPSDKQQFTVSMTKWAYCAHEVIPP